MKKSHSAPIPAPIREIVVPIDAIQTKLSDLRPILQTAQRLGASVTLLHCYVAPPSFDFAAGDGAVRELSTHRSRVRSRLHKITAGARKLFRNCRCRFVSGSPSTQILRQSQRLLADLIAVPLPLDLVRWCWLPEELLDELVRRASCPVLCLPASQTLAETPIINSSGPTDADLLASDVEPDGHRLATFES